MKRYLSHALIAMVMGVGGLAFAQQDGRQSDADRDKKLEANDALAFQALATEPQCFTSGSPAGSPNDPFGRTFFKVCITERGNISELESPAGKTQIVSAREGYAVCSGINADTVHGFDAGIAEDGWGIPTVTQSNGPGTLPLVIRRDSLDGKVRLTQTFTINTGAREIQVAMAVKNLTASTLSLLVARYFDGDIEGTSSDDRYDLTRDSVWGTPKSTNSVATGLMLTQNASSIGGSLSIVEKFSDWTPSGSSFQNARKCNAIGHQAVPTLAGDFVGRLVVDPGPMNPGQTRTVTYRYRRF